MSPSIQLKLLFRIVWATIFESITFEVCTTSHSNLKLYVFKMVVPKIHHLFLTVLLTALQSQYECVFGKTIAAEIFR